MVSIDGYGGYVPRYRIDREAVAAQHGGSASGESAVPARDETHVTMAAEAAGNALARAAASPDDLGAVYAASVTDPFAEHGIAAQVAYRLGATGDVRTGDFRASARAAADAFAAGIDRVEAAGAPALVLGVDVMPVEPGHDDEPYAGAGAGAVVLTAEQVENRAAEVHGVGTDTTGFVERHRLHGEPPVFGDRRFEGEAGFGDAVPQATQAAMANAPAMPSRVTVQAPDQRQANAAVAEFPGEVEHVSTFDGVGYAGTATFFLDLVQLLETADPGQTGLAVSYGAGGADAVCFTTEEGVPADGEAAPTVAQLLDSKTAVTYADHLRFRERPVYAGVSLE